MKLHLPKQLFTALIAAMACAQLAIATEYTVTKGSTVDFHSCTFADSNNEAPNANGDVTQTVHGGTDKWRAFWRDPNNATTRWGDHTIKFEDEKPENAEDVTLTIGYTDFAVGAIIVGEKSQIKEILGNTTSGKREIYIGKSGGTYSSSFGRNFALTTKNIFLNGTQTWTVSNSKLLTLNGTVQNSADLTLQGKVNFANELQMKDASNLLVKNGSVVTATTITSSGSHNTNRKVSIEQGASVTTGEFKVAYNLGSVDVDGELEVTTELYLGSNNDDNVTSLLTGDGSVTATKFRAGNWGSYGVNVATLSIGASGLVLENGAVLNLASTTTTVAGTTTVNSGNELNFNAGTATLTGAVTNNGNVNVKGGSATLTGAVTNNGNVNVNGGSVTLNGGMSGTGTVNLSGGNLTFGSGENITNTIAQFNYSGGTLTHSGLTVTNAAFSGGTLVNTGALTLNGTLNIVNQSALTESGTASYSDGDNGFYRGSYYVIKSDGDTGTSLTLGEGGFVLQLMGTTVSDSSTSGANYWSKDGAGNLLLTIQGNFGAYYVNKNTVTVGGSSATTGVEAASAFHVASGAKLDIAELPTGWTAAELLAGKVTGAGTLLVSKSGLATGNANLTTTFGGTLELAKGVTFTLGAVTAGSSGDSKEIVTTSLASVVLNAGATAADGSKLQYHANGNSTLTNLTVNALSENEKGTATLNYVDSNEANAVTLAGTTQLNGNLNITTSYDGGFTISKLSGTGDLSVTGANGTFNATIQSLQNYTGSLSFSDSDDSNQINVEVSTGETGGALDMGSITASDVASFTFNVDRNTTVDTITAVGGTVNLNNGASLTLDGAEGSTIGTVNLAAGTTLTLGQTGADAQETTSSIGTLTTGSGSTVTLNSGANLTLTSVSGVSGKIVGDGTLTLNTGDRFNGGNGIPTTLFATPLNELVLTGNGTCLEITSSGQMTAFNNIKNLVIKNGATFGNRLTGQTIGSADPHTLTLAGAGNGTGASAAALAFGNETKNKADMTMGHTVHLSDDATVWVNASRKGILSGTVNGANHVLTKTGSGELDLQGEVKSTSLAVNEGTLNIAGASSSETVDLNGGTLKLGSVATITSRQDANAAMTKVSMSTAGISTTATDGTKGTISNANVEIAQLAADASFTIQDMTLSNVKLSAAQGTTVALNNLSGTAELAGAGSYNIGTGAAQYTLGMTPAQVGTIENDNGGTALTLSYSSNTAITMSGTGSQLWLSADPTVDANGIFGTYNLTLTLNYTLNGIDTPTTTEGWQELVGFTGILGDLLTAPTPEATVDLAEGEAAVAAAGTTPTVEYNYKAPGEGAEVGMLVITINGLNVPEPASATLGLAALMMLCARRRRKA